MGSFKKYMENQDQEDLVSKAMTKLYYQAGLSPDKIANTDLATLSNLLQQFQMVDPNSVSPARFAAMVKLAARMSVNNMQITPDEEE